MAAISASWSIGGKEKNAVCPFVVASGEKISVLLYALVDIFGVFGMQDFSSNVQCSAIYFAFLRPIIEKLAFYFLFMRGIKILERKAKFSILNNKSKSAKNVTRFIFTLKYLGKG